MSLLEIARKPIRVKLSDEIRKAQERLNEERIRQGIRPVMVRRENISYLVVGKRPDPTMKPELKITHKLTDFEWIRVLLSKNPNYRFVEKHRILNWEGKAQYILLDVKRRIRVAMTKAEMMERLKPEKNAVDITLPQTEEVEIG